MNLAPFHITFTSEMVALISLFTLMLYVLYGMNQNLAGSLVLWIMTKSKGCPALCVAIE